MDASAQPEPGGGPRYRLTQLPDGTVRQVSPLTGTVVWTVPGRSHRPLPRAAGDPRPLTAGDSESRCAFCPGRYGQTPPEKSRLVCAGSATVAPAQRVVRHLTADRLHDTVAEVRRFPNLFEILSYEYWHANHGFEIPGEVRQRAERYADTAAGRAHLLEIMRTRKRASGLAVDEIRALPDEVLLAQSVRLFASTHDVLVARRHFVDGATHDDQLASAGDLTPDEHFDFLYLAVDSLHDLTARTPFAVYVVAFQNWLAAAGASFEHLHKQLVAIDEYGPLLERIIDLTRATPDLFTAGITDRAAVDGLVIAENDHALAVAGVGHRYPTVEVYSKARAHRPWEHSQDQLQGMSDLLHACHAATGRLVPTNEEWHYRPVDVDVAMPWRINLKWRISTLAGFEGVTKINVNTISPGELRARMVGALHGLRTAGRVADLAVGDECRPRTGVLRYADP